MGCSASNPQTIDLTPPIEQIDSHSINSGSLRQEYNENKTDQAICATFESNHNKQPTFSETNSIAHGQSILNSQDVHKSDVNSSENHEDMNGNRPIPLPQQIRVIDPNIGFIIKTRRNNAKDKVFINIFYHSIATNLFQPFVDSNKTILTSSGIISKDKKSDVCIVYSALISESLFQEVGLIPNTRHETCLLVILHINAQYHRQNEEEALSLIDYKIPKIKRGYVGDIIPEVFERVEQTIEIDAELLMRTRGGDLYQSILNVAEEHQQRTTTDDGIGSPSSSVTPSQSTTPVYDAQDDNELIDVHGIDDYTRILDLATIPRTLRYNDPPPIMKGWVMKQGHLVKNWKQRYMVLSSGCLSYYVDQDSEPPYGKWKKGSVYLIGYVLDSMFSPTASRQSVDRKDRSIHLLLSATSLKEKGIEEDDVNDYIAKEEVPKPSEMLLRRFSSSNNSVASQPTEFLFEVKEIHEALAWKAAILEHIEYIEYIESRLTSKR